MWTARSFDEDQVFDPGERVEVVEIRGTTALDAEPADGRRDTDVLDPSCAIAHFAHCVLLSLTLDRLRTKSDLR